MMIDISAEERTWLSPWVTLIKRSVTGMHGSPAPSVYHALSVADYVSILAETPEGTFPVIRQYRPAVKAMTWELPAGTVDAGETPETTCARELREEVGREALSVRHLGSFFSDTGRIDNKIHLFHVKTGPLLADFVPEPGTSVAYWDRHELLTAIQDGRFNHLLHIATIGLLALDMQMGKVRHGE